MTQPTRDPVDRMEQLSACLRCIADLLIPESDLHVVNRDDMATALGFLVTEFEAARTEELASRRPLRVA